MKETFFAVVNPVAGGGRCGRLSGAALERVRDAGIGLEVVRTNRPGEATDLARDAYARGFRNFLVVGGDGTAYEILNGIFPQALADGRPALGFLPLGTGNSFLRDFTSRGPNTRWKLSEAGCDARATSFASATRTVKFSSSIS